MAMACGSDVDVEDSSHDRNEIKDQFRTAKHELLSISHFGSIRDFPAASMRSALPPSDVVCSTLYGSMGHQPEVDFAVMASATL
jgi:hypothetical protein